MRLIEVTPGADGVPHLRIQHLDATKKLLFDWPSSLNDHHDYPRGEAVIIDLGVAAGTARWQLTHFDAGTQCVVHRTHTVDCHSVLAGQLELLLGDSTSIELDPGDLILIGGVDHAWRTGSEGALTSATLFGILSDTDEVSVPPQEINRLTWRWNSESPAT